MPSTAESDAEDVNDFLKRIQELGTKRDQEDEERNKKLEEEILQGRKERQARRAERARSISPLKDSPANTPLSYKSLAADSPSQLSNAAFTPSRELQPPPQSADHGTLLDDTMERLTGERSPTKGSSRLETANNRDTPEKAPKLSDTIRTSPSSAMPSRGSTLSWQRRPASQASDRPKTRPLSVIATENAARSPRATPEPSSQAEDTAPMARDAIAQSLASKDPTWFRQTADRGQGSAAYRKTQVEDKDIAEAPLNASRMQLPGMSRPMNSEPGNSREADRKDMDRSSSPSGNSSSNGSAGLSSFGSTASTRTTIGSPVPTTSAQWLSHPGSTTSSDGIRDQTVRGLAMSPSQGRISPERLDRPISPTKGMGGFVQSAMMKRSDSVNKRWSVQSSGGLSRGNSLASNRSQDLTSSASLGNLYNPSTREPRPSSLSRETTPLSTSRPNSSHGNATVAPDGDQSNVSNSFRSTMVQPIKDDGFVRPSLPASKSQPSVDISSKEPIDQIASPIRSETPQPLSPSKTGDTRRWSPTKSSWLESALNKPDSPKPKPVAPQQPSWMSEIKKAKEKANPDSPSTNVTVKHKHQVSIGGLLRSPPIGGPAKPLNIGGLPAGFSSGIVQKGQPRNGSLTDTAQSPRVAIQENKSTEATKSGEKFSRSEIPKSSDSVPTSSPALITTGKVKPETPPKKDFRASLKPRQVPLHTNGKEEPEFKNVFGQLRRTKTENYVAPDELKDNILRGKAGLNLTDGPKKSELKDEFKEAILKKKEDFKKAQLEGTGVTKSTNAREVQLPEALLKKASLGRSNTIAPGNRDSKAATEVSADLPLRNRLPSNPPKPSLLHETTAPGRLQGKFAPRSKLAERFNPALAGLLARGPSPGDGSTAKGGVSPSETGQPVATKVAGSQESGPQLTHMTKGRARGPKRKAPSAVAAATGSKDRVDAAQTPKPAIVSRQTESKSNNAEPSSPDLKQRSKFLEETPSKNDNIQIRKTTTPMRKTDIDQGPKESPGPNKSERKFTPTTKPKPSSLSTSPAIDSGKFDTPIKPKPSSLSTSPAIDIGKFDTPTKPSEISRSQSKPSQPASEGVNDESVSSVRDTKALFNRSVFLQAKSDNVQLSPSVKSPIKLPTQQDENTAMINAGLRSPQSEIQSSRAEVRDTTDYTKSATLGRQPFQSSRPLPTPPLKITKSPTPDIVKPLTPRKSTAVLTPQLSETSKTLAEFFDRTDSPQGLSVDTATIIAKKSDYVSRITSQQAQIYQIGSDGKKQTVPRGQERILFEGNMYLCIHTFTTHTGNKCTDAYLWTGDDVSESVAQDAEFFAQREARNVAGKLAKIRQGHETPEFIDALGGIIIIHRGQSHRFDSLAPHMLCARQSAGRIIFDEVDFAPSSLCSGFPYIISTQSGKCYLWKGKGSGIDELSSARLVGMEFGLTGEIEEIEDGKEPSSFLKIFGDNASMMKSADHWRLKPNYSKYHARLFISDPESPAKITEITPFSQSSISPSHIYILDAFFEIYILVGSRAQTQYAAFCTALLFAQEYGILAAGMEDRPFVPVSTVVLEGAPRDMRFVFRKWREERPAPGLAPGKGLTRGKSLRVVPLTAALEATKL